MNTQNNALLKQVKNNLTVRNRSSYLLSSFDIPGLRLKSPFVAERSEEIDEAKKEYQLGEFLAFYDIEFLIFAYGALLGRAPDEESMKNLLHELRKHKKPRVDIIHRMANSAECAPRGISVAGLDRAYFISRLSSIRVLGFFVRLLLAVRHIGRLQADQEHLRGLLEAARQEAYRRDEVVTSNQNKVSQWLARETGNHDWHLK